MTVPQVLTSVLCTVYDYYWIFCPKSSSFINSFLTVVVPGQKSEPVVQTLATKLAGKAFAPPEVVVFDDARKRSRQRKELAAAKNSANQQVDNLPKVKLDDDTELSMKQAR